jgi:segregation and condensation protein B
MKPGMKGKSLETEKAVNIIEAILFVSEEPVSIKKLEEVLDELPPEKIAGCLGMLRDRLENHGLELVEIAEGWQIRTLPEMGEWVKKFHKISRSTRLSRAALEVLSIIAYRQPIIRQEIEDIRGVDSAGIVKKLLEKNLIRLLGRRRLPGKPMTFGTSKKFLEYFGLVKLSDLPALKDFAGTFSAAEQADFVFTTEPKSEEKEPADILLEKEAEMIEPVEEDYEDNIDEEESFGKN